MANKKVQFLPFHAINDFMRSEYRADVVASVMSALPDLPEDQRKRINALTKKHVQVPGFRNSALAPAALRAKHLAAKFEKQPELAAAILSAWSEAHPELRQQVYDLLTERGWELFPLTLDRAELPGFQTRWPKDEDFEQINHAFTEKYPDAGAREDDVSLMVVWLSGRLPYEKVGDEAQPEA